MVLLTFPSRHFLNAKSYVRLVRQVVVKFPIVRCRKLLESLCAAGKGQVLAKGDGDVTEDGEQGAEPNDGLPSGHFVDLLDPHGSSATLHAVRGTVERGSRPERRGLVEHTHEAGESAVHLCSFFSSSADVAEHTNIL